MAFVNPFAGYARGVNSATVYPPLGLAYMAAVLRNRGYEVLIVDANVLRLSNERVIKCLREFEPDIVGITSNIVLARACVELSGMVDRSLGRPVIIGGPHATSTAGKTLVDSGALCVVRGEGEETIADLLENADSLPRVAGISFISEGKVVHNPDREFIGDLDSLPFPAYDLLPGLKSYTSRSRRIPMAPLLTHRGCPYDCIYCNKDIFGKIFRHRSPENIVKEIEFLVGNYGVKGIDVLDDNFTFLPDKAEEILDLLIERKIDVSINLQVGIRADRLSRVLIGKMKKAGVNKVGVGIESADENVLRAARKSLDLRKVEQAVQWLREEGMVVSGFFMLGLPLETAEGIEKTIEYAKRLNPHLANFSITVPFPGTELYRMIEKDGRFIKPTESGIDGGFFHPDIYFRLNNLGGDEVVRYHKKAFREFYFRPSKILDILFTLRSLNEFRWAARTAWETLRGMF
jgi:radical SAM superfamily enzyme YgiQ (UPF0313 family)